MIDEIYSRITAVFEKLENYTYEIVFFDDGSTDGTRDAIEKICSQHNEVKSVLYTRNFGYLRSTFYCMQQAKGDCAIIIHADLQNPPEVIPEFLEKWENGSQVVLGVKNQSRENKFVYFLRTIFYFVMIKIFGVKIFPHATEFELFDKSFVEILKKIKVNNPFLRGIVTEYASNIDFVYYIQDARKKGKSKFNVNKYYDFAICGITQHSSRFPRKVIFGCVIALIVMLLEFCFMAIPKFFTADILSISDSVILRCILGAVLIAIIVISILFEYVISIKNNIDEKPLVVEEKRINY
jgi:glycosyltransferase involved in cell wall biosynthesis